MSIVIQVRSFYSAILSNLVTCVCKMVVAFCDPGTFSHICFENPFLFFVLFWFVFLVSKPIPEHLPLNFSKKRNRITLIGLG